jgi:flagellar hook assembly protein FlgD
MERINRVEIAIYDANGELVRRLAPGSSDIIVHSASFSSNPFMISGSNQLVIRDAQGWEIGRWDGDNTGGASVFSGPYTVHVVTTDVSGNEYILDSPIDVVTSNTLAVNNLTIRYLAGSVRIMAALNNAQSASVRIYNINAELVRKYAVIQANALDVTWDLKTSSGKAAAHGVYVAVIEVKDANTGYLTRRIEKIAVK